VADLAAGTKQRTGTEKLHSLTFTPYYCPSEDILGYGEKTSRREEELMKREYHATILFVQRGETPVAAMYNVGGYKLET
jgi:hypothetical protein